MSEMDKTKTALPPFLHKCMSTLVPDLNWKYFKVLKTQYFPSNILCFQSPIEF